MTRWQGLGFFALCLWSSAGWLIEDGFSLPGTSASGQGFRFLLVGMLALGVSWQRSKDEMPSGWHMVQLGMVSLGLLGVPILLLTAAQGRVASTSVALTFALMPILLMVADAMDLSLLAFGLMGVGGLMVLLPARLPSSGMAAGLVLAAMASTACSMIWLHRLLKGLPLGIALGAAGIGNGLLLLVAGIPEMDRWSVRVAGMEVMRCVLVDLPETMLLIWLIKAVSPVKVSARYLVAPLLTVIEGLALVRPRFEVRMLVGLALLGLGAYRVLTSESQPEETSLKLG